MKKPTKVIDYYGQTAHDYTKKTAGAPILHLICGLPGAGKTTLAKEIAAANGAVRFCPDAWIKDIWKENSDAVGGGFRKEIEQLQWQTAKQILKNSVDVIIEWGTWDKDERAKIRDEARELGAKVKFYYLDFPTEILRERIIKRNGKLTAHDFFIPENDIEPFLNGCRNLLQIPTAEELSSYDYLG